MKHLLFFKAFLFLLFFGIISCGEQPGEQDIKQVNVYLTDCPFEAEEVNVEILSISLEDDQGFMINLNTIVGIYNLLDFQDGVDTLIATGNVDFETIESMYFTLGTNNTIVVDGVTHPLELHQGNDQVKVKMDLAEISNNADYLVDFFACTSIIKKGNQGYVLKPVIKFKGEKNNGGGNGFEIEDLIEDFEECYDIQYPIDLLDVDGNVLTAQDDDELADIVINNELSGIVYPVNLLDENGAVVEINSEADFQQLDDCDDDNQGDEEFVEEFIEELDDCFELVYPISFANDQGDQFTANNEDELEDLKEEGSINAVVFPIKLLDENGDEVEVLDSNELGDLLEICQDNSNNQYSLGELLVLLSECYEIVYPVSFTDSASLLITVNSNSELLDATNSSQIAEIDFPLEVTKNNVQVPVNNINQLNARVNTCNENNQFRDKVLQLKDCYGFVYPIRLIEANGNEVEITSDAELEDIFQSNHIKQFVFPFEILDQNGSNLNVVDDSQVDQLLLDC